MNSIQGRSQRMELLCHSKTSCCHPKMNYFMYEMFHVIHKLMIKQKLRLDAQKTNE